MWWEWYYWACPVAWTLYGLVGSQYGDVDKTIGNTNQTMKAYVDEYYGIEHDFLGVVAVVNVVFGLLFAFIFALSIKFLNFQRR